VVIGFVGSATNGLILYALMASKQHRKQALIFNQNLLDFASSFFLFTTNLAKLAGISLEGRRGYWLCLTVLSEFFNWGPFLGSLINLANNHASIPPLSFFTAGRMPFLPPNQQRQSTEGLRTANRIL